MVLVRRFSEIAASPANFAGGDFLVGVRGGTTDVRYSHTQVSAGLGGINVANYGAVGDGVHNDSAAFQAANDAAAAYGGSLYIPATLAGYLITQTINITCRHVFGDAMFIDGGDLGTIINWAPSAPSDLLPCFDCTGIDGATVQDLSIFGPGNYSPATLVSSGAVTPGLLPNYSAFVSGVAGFGTSSAGKVTFIRCCAQHVKAGLLLNNEQGHVFSNGCNWGGGNLFGVYCRTNSGDYRFFQSQMAGNAWCGILFGTRPFGGHNGGMDGSFYESGIGQQPYGFYQCDDGGVGASNASGYSFVFLDTHFEALGESVIWALDSDASSSRFILLDNPGFSWDTSGYILPDAIIAAGSKQAYMMNLGNVNRFQAPYNSQSGSGNFQVSAINVNGKIARIYTDSSDGGQLDYNALLANGPITIVNKNILKDDLRFLPIYDYQHRQERAVNSAVLQTANMVVNPETPANWTVSNVVVTLSNYTTLVGGALSTATFPRQFFEELGDNPNCVVFTPSNANWSARLPFNPSPFGAGLHCPAMSFWFVKAGSAFQYRARLECQSSVLIYDNTYTLGTTATKIWGVGGNSGGQGYNNFALFTGASINPVYVFGLMIALDDLSQYNPTQGPSLIGTPFLQSQTTASSATGGAASALPALPVAYLTVNIAGTLRKIPYYSV